MRMRRGPWLSRLVEARSGWRTVSHLLEQLAAASLLQTPAWRHSSILVWRLSFDRRSKQRKLGGMPTANRGWAEPNEAEQRSRGAGIPRLWAGGPLWEVPEPGA